MVLGNISTALIQFRGSCGFIHYVWREIGVPDLYLSVNYTGRIACDRSEAYLILGHLPESSGQGGDVWLGEILIPVTMHVT